MKTLSSICTVVVLLLLLMSGACNKKSDADPQTGAGQGSATVKLTQNGKVVTQYTAASAGGVGGGSYSIALSSADTKHSLVLDIDGELTGTYPFINTSGHEQLTNGKANFMYQSYDLPPVYPGTAGLLIPGSGEVIVKTATKTRCSGTFTSSGVNDKDGKTYTLEGTFDVPID